MCGIVGFWAAGSGQNSESLTSTVNKMAGTLRHRGPDGGNAWCDPEAGIALGHRRLAIIDLSENGSQPMASASGRYILTYNGEIYNFLDLKSLLEARKVKFKGTSDTEVLLAAIEEWGLEDALKRCNGMFAFALWDRKERSLTLARDRIGKKPLYYGRAGKSLLFASELKAFHAHQDFSPVVDRDALAAYIRHNYVPAPASIFKGIYKLPPASFITISQSDIHVENIHPPTQRYWHISDARKAASQNRSSISVTSAINELKELLSDAVVKRMIADVPLGVFLSGGIDSSLITALMQASSSRPVRSYCIAFEESGFNEAQEAAKIASHLGTDHTEFTVTAAEAREIIPLLPDIYDEPFADPSQIPTYCVSRLAAGHVTVALAGDGGDEGFFGYRRYSQTAALANILRCVPYSMRVAAKNILEATPAGGRVRKLAEVMDARNDDELYVRLMSYHQNPSSFVIGGRESPFIMNNADIGDFRERMMLHDTLAYLPDDILVKVDRASMASSLEVRAPLLDYRILEYAWQLPLDLKYRENKGKWLLKEVLKEYIPESLFDRPKKGFGIPHDEWLRGPLHSWAESLLDERRLQQEGFFHPAAIRKKWQEHLSGRRNWHYHIWGILMFQAWQERWLQRQQA